MDIDLETGRYVVAVSGGVDSVVLLDLLRKNNSHELIVAHFDHGIRDDSAEDRLFVQALAKKYDLPFEYSEGKLGARTSEAKAREARYEFLRDVHKRHGASAIVTAHHQDDLIETAIINMLRGTGRKGLSSLKDSSDTRRPLLRSSKQEIIDYARAQNLQWREDSTNQEDTYLRNYVRLRLIPRFNPDQKDRLLNLLDDSGVTNEKIDKLLGEEMSSHASETKLDKSWLKQLPHDVSKEVIAAWLRNSGIRGFDRGTVERLVVFAKTGRPGQHFDIINGNIMRVEKDFLALDMQER